MADTDMAKNVNSTEAQAAGVTESQAAEVTETREASCPACCGGSEELTGKTKERTEKEKKDLMNRLARIEGQVKGVRRMVEEDVYCIDILTQVSAISSALNSFNKELLGRHIRGCVKENVENGNDEVIDELVKTMQKLMK